ncbi:MAG: enoyl-CoA hydratase-related protein, partial [Acidimicrobiales bacterium]
MTISGTDTEAQPRAGQIDFERSPDHYRHWRLTIEPPLARLRLAVDVDGGLLGGYELKLNSYDIGVDIELADAIRRLRFEHPDVGCVVIDSAAEGVFCAGANIRMLAGADHGHKVNFCKFTNETRLEMEEASACSGLKFLAAVNGPCSGGGYELAMACDHILLIDDRSSAVSLPEVPLLGVLPGTGGLTRLTDKRHVRRDLADVFATKAEGVRGADALRQGLVDEIASPSEFEDRVTVRARAMADELSRTSLGAVT